MVLGNTILSADHCKYDGALVLHVLQDLFLDQLDAFIALHLVDHMDETGEVNKSPNQSLVEHSNFKQALLHNS